MADSTVTFSNKFLDKGTCISDVVKKNNIDYGLGTLQLNTNLYYNEGSTKTLLLLPAADPSYPDTTDLWVEHADFLNFYSEDVASPYQLTKVIKSGTKPLFNKQLLSLDGGVFEEDRPCAALSGSERQFWNRFKHVEVYLEGYSTDRVLKIKVYSYGIFPRTVGGANATISEVYYNGSFSNNAVEDWFLDNEYTFTAADFVDGVIPTKLLIFLQAAGGPGGLGAGATKGGSGGGSGAAATLVVNLNNCTGGSKFIIEVPPTPAMTDQYYTHYMDFDNHCGIDFFRPGQANLSYYYYNYVNSSTTRLLTLNPGKTGAKGSESTTAGGAGGTITYRANSSTTSSGYYWMVQALPGGAGGSKGSDGNIPSGTSFEVVGKLRLYASKGSTLKSRGKHKKDVTNAGQGLGYTTTKTGGGAASVFGPGGDGASASGTSSSVIGQAGYRGSGGGGNASVAAPTYGGGGYLAIYY